MEGEQNGRDEAIGLIFRATGLTDWEHHSGLYMLSPSDPLLCDHHGMSLNMVYDQFLHHRCPNFQVPESVVASRVPI